MIKWWVLIIGIIIANPLLANCKIDTHPFGTSSSKIEKSVSEWGSFEPIPNVNKEIFTSFETICPELKNSRLGRETNVFYHFIKDKLVAIELVLQTTDKLELFEWGKKQFGISEERDLAKAEQVIQVEDGNRIIQLFVGVLPDVTFQNVVLISTKHDDLFEYQYQQEDNINWDTYEMAPLEPITLGEEN